MKHILTVIAALLVMAGLAAAQAKFTIVTGTETPIGLANPSEVKCHGGLPTGNPFAPCPPGTSGTVRGQQRLLQEDTSDARTNGLNYGIFNANIHEDVTLNAWGMFRLEVSGGGVWEGVWEGKQAADGSFSYRDRKSTRLNSSHANISYAVFCLKTNNDHSAARRRAARPSAEMRTARVYRLE